MRGKSAFSDLTLQKEQSMAEGFQGFLVDQIAVRDRELLTKYADFVRCSQLDPEATYRYAITILHGRRNPDRCQVVPSVPLGAADTPPPIQYSTGNPPSPIAPPTPEKLVENLGPLRTCRLLENGVHMHQCQ